MPAVNSKDGTRVAYHVRGQGPAIILVGGALSTGAAGIPIAELLAPDFTVYCIDRRGRGDSTDVQPYSVDKEVDDIEALIDAAGGSACLCGVSSGGALVLEAAMRLGGKVRKLAVYEVPYDSSEAGVKAWREYTARLTGLLAQDKREDAVVSFLEFVGMPRQALDGMRKAPMWPSMAALAPTLAYDCAVVGEDRKVPVERAASIRVPALFMDGSASQATLPFMRATAEALTKAVPGARHQVLDGQGHAADPKVLAGALRAFFGS